MNLRDLLVFSGLALVSTGAGLLLMPAGLIVAGLGLFAIGWRPVQVSAAAPAQEHRR